MNLCGIKIHKFSQWRQPRNGFQTRICLMCGKYERSEVRIHTIGTVISEEVYPVHLTDLGIIEEVEDESRQSE